MQNKKNIVQEQKKFFLSQATKPIKFRIAQLQKLDRALVKFEKEMLTALEKDLGKNALQSYLSEISRPRQEIALALKKLHCWSKPKKVPTPVVLFPTQSYLYPEPYGTVLIISPWNYPFQLTFTPLINALAAGNTAVLKPSEFAPASSTTLATIIAETFIPELVAVVEGGVPETQELLKEKFDYILFTGSTSVGKLVMAQAAQHVTPLTLELGGKSPCVVDTTADLAVAAERIVWGKFRNAGQSCIAPDFLLIHEDIKEKFIPLLIHNITHFFPTDAHPQEKIINLHHTERLAELLRHGNILHGGQVDYTRHIIQPTLMDHVDMNSSLMQDEIFGPILPIVTFSTSGEIFELIQARPKPLALYLFSRDSCLQKKFLQSTSSGSLVFNDVSVQATSPYLPFGGVGLSGFGAYHGVVGFRTFSHMKPVMHTPAWVRFSFRSLPEKLLFFLARFF